MFDLIVLNVSYHLCKELCTFGLLHGSYQVRKELIPQYFTFQTGQGEPKALVSLHQIGNSEGSERRNVLQRSTGSAAVLGDMVSQS